MGDNTFTATLHPQDPVYAMNRRKMLDAQAHLSKIQLDRQVQYLMSQPPPGDSGDTTKNVMAELSNASFVPQKLKAILDTTGGGTSGGSTMIRQDLEVPLYLLFVDFATSKSNLC